jgi:hypothetical protein
LNDVLACSVLIELGAGSWLVGVSQVEARRAFAAAAEDLNAFIQVSRPFSILLKTIGL